MHPLILPMAFIIIAMMIIIASAFWLYFLFQGKKLGESCQLDTDCIGWGPAPNAVACCQLKCTEKAVDYLGVGYCPIDCKGCPTCKLGTCGPWHTPKQAGEPCGLHTDCAGYGPGANDMACCNYKCKQKVRDWAGVGQCPNECRRGPESVPSTCYSSWSWPRKIGQPCAVHTDCEGWGPAADAVACCGYEGANKVCKKKMRDYLGIGYCPHECKASIGSPPGSCSDLWHWPRKIGEPCSIHEDCEGYGPGGRDTACCMGFCRRKQEDYTGVGYCPNECKASPDSPPGSCSDKWRWPRHQSEPCDIDTNCANWSVFGSVACCWHHCVTKEFGSQTCPDFCNGHYATCTAPYPK